MIDHRKEVIALQIYANLLGTWTDITNAGTIGDNKDPVTFVKEQLIYSDGSGTADCWKYDYINVQYDGKNYRIHPSMIQIVK